MRSIGKLIGLALIIAVGFFAYQSREKIPFLQSIPWLGGKQDKKISAKDFEFRPVERRDIRQTVQATGTVTVKTGAEVKIGARISGQLKKLNVKIGDFVHRGAVIAVIDHEDLQARVAQRHAELRLEAAQLVKVRQEGPMEVSKARAEIEELRVQLQLADKMFARNKELNEQGIVSNSVLDQALQDMEVLKAKIRVGEENVRLMEARMGNDILLHDASVAKAEATLREGETQLSFSTIKATIDGIVAFVSTQEGETVVAGLSAPTFVTLIDLKKLEVTVFVDETDIGRIKLGHKAVFTVDSYPDKFFKGTVGDIHPKAVIKENVVNYEVMLEIDKEQLELLRPEMTANVVVTTGNREKVLAIPKEAVKRTGKKQFAMVRVNEAPEERPIETGWRDGGMIEVTSGLKEGEPVGVPLKPAADNKEKPGPGGAGGGGGPPRRR